MSSREQCQEAGGTDWSANLTNEVSLFIYSEARDLREECALITDWEVVELFTETSSHMCVVP